MENHSFSSYADSRDSSPRSREIPDPEDNPNPSTTVIPPKVKFMCSYGGKIQPRPHDNQLAYIGGDTKILSVDRNIKFSSLLSKLSSLCDSDLCFKYQLPGEDLDALISVTNDEDLQHMMVEYDRLYRASAKPARLRLFLFPILTNSSVLNNFGSADLKSERQWFVDALNSVQISPLVDEPPPPPAVAVAQVSATCNPDFLFGFDKAYPVGVPQAVNLPDNNILVPPAADVAAPAKESLLSQAEIQRQIQDLQRLHIVNNEQVLQQRKSDEGNGRVYNVDYLSQKSNPDSLIPPPNTPPSLVHTGQMPASTAAFLSERHMTSTGFTVVGNSVNTDQQQQQQQQPQPVYLIQTPAGVYHATTLRPMSGQVGQPYYGVPRMVPADMYNVAPPAVSISHNQAPKVGGYSESSGVVQQQKVGVAESGFAHQVGYDNAGRQVYYTPAVTSAPAPAVGVVPPYQVVTAGVDGRQQGGVSGGGALNQEGKSAAKVSSAV